MHSCKNTCPGSTSQSMEESSKSVNYKILVDKCCSAKDLKSVRSMTVHAKSVVDTGVTP